MNKLAIALTAALSLGAAASASAADGTITFTGRVVAAACSIDYSEGAAIALGNISSGNLDGNSDAGMRTFDITLKAGTGTTTCAGNNAKLHIDTTASDLNADGSIKNTHADDATLSVVLTRTDGTAKELDLGNITDELNHTKTASEFKYSFAARYKKTKTGTDFVEGNFAGKLVFDVENF
ncbi:fimbrial protein [Stenotrophomonas maltophilia]|uniref:fimbrial protein n=1 Tax=Stenotrophomonas maltophilia TaxID=40324 RepID=UPI000DA83FD6|nr:fimbrial protein [Stenotrophomonas maltophilia]PZS73317.1 hypothetical protein A7X75_06445 [Stenotrophomonas maltophilia]